MYFSTSPPCARIAVTWQSKYRFRISTTVSAGSRSDSAVKPRRSDSQIAAFIVSVWPRLICPPMIRSPARLPT
jgi:hypothetical protein